MHMTEKEFQEYLKTHPHARLNEPKKTRATNSRSTTSFKATKKRKYRNTKVYEYVNGEISYEKREPISDIVEVYDSKKEYERWVELKRLEQINEISSLSRQTTLLIQPSFTYHGKKIHAIKYKADFTYINRNNERVVEDVKPFDKSTSKYRLTKDFVLKWKILKHNYPDTIFVLY